MVAACGNHCCVPGCQNSGPLEQGHIIPNADGGDDSPENLIPACQRCNKRIGKIGTPDGRPVGWRERLIQLLGYAVQPKFITLHENSSCYMKPAGEGVDTQEVIKWQKPEFAAGTGVFTSSNVTRKVAVSMVEQIKRLSQMKTPAPYLPKGTRNGQPLRANISETGLVLLINEE